jgi:TolB-like protein/DNA-binding winged helix-turn-helix (wHTH) protein/Tfp pilus assembly protein PilF
MTRPPRQILSFATFEVDPHAGELRKGGRRVHLQEKPLQVLLLLLDHAGDSVSRDQLREALWSADTFVDFDHSLGTAIAKLRSALGDSARSPRFIETLGGRGYRFIAPVTATLVDRPAAGPTTIAPTVGAQGFDQIAAAVVVQAAAPEASPHTRAAVASMRRVVLTLAAGLVLGAAVLAIALGTNAFGARDWLRRQSTPQVRSLAVLPLRNLSNDAAEEYLVDGMTEQLIATLAQLPGLEVISRTSAMRYKETRRTLPEIGRELNADVLIEGSVVRSGSRVRVTAQLIDARTDQHLWAQSYDRDFADVLTLQNDIARSIADEIRVKLTPATRADLSRPRVIVPAAQEAYLRARYHLNKGDEAEVRKSVDDFNQAIALDPKDARSYAGLSQAYVALTDFYDRPTEAMPRARAAAEKAIALDETLADAHTSLGAVRFLYDWDWAGSEASFKRAIALNRASADAHVWYGVFLAQMGRFDEAAAEMMRANALDPLSVFVHISAGWVLYLSRKDAEAIAEWKKALDLEPNLGVAHTSIWLAYARQGQGDVVSLVREVAGDTSPLNLATLAGVYAMSGQRAAAEGVIARLTAIADHRYVCPYEIASAHAALQHDDEAIKWLRRGVEDRSSCMPDLKVDPRFDRLRHDPRFVQLLKDIGFAPAGDQP